MASGYFPIDASGEIGQKLVAAHALIREAIGVYYDNGMVSDLTPEDALSDGGYLADLGRASEWLRSAVREWPEAASKRALLAAREKRLTELAEYVAKMKAEQVAVTPEEGGKEKE